MQLYFSGNNWMQKYLQIRVQPCWNKWGSLNKMFYYFTSGPVKIFTDIFIVYLTVSVVEKYKEFTMRTVRFSKHYIFCISELWKLWKKYSIIIYTSWNSNNWEISNYLYNEFRSFMVPFKHLSPVVVHFKTE